MKATEEGKPASVKVSFKVKKTGKASKYSYVSKVNVVEDKLTLTAEATHVKEIVVTANKAFEDASKVKATVKKGTADRGCTATVEGSKITLAMDAKLTKGSYTITVEGAEDTAITVPLEVEKDETLTSFEISDYIVAKSVTETTTGSIKYAALNQYGDKMTANEPTVTCSFGTVLNQKPKKAATATAEGEIEVTGINPVLAIVGTKGTVVLVGDMGVTSTKEISYNTFAKATSAEVVGTYHKNSAALKNITEGDKIEDYELLLSFKDQYGYGVGADSLNGVRVTITGGLTNINVDATSFTTRTLNGVDYVAVQLNSATAYAGDATLTIVNQYHGMLVNDKISVAKNVVIKSMTVTADNGVYYGQDNEMGYEFIDADGKAVTSYATLKNCVNLNTATTGFRFEQKADGTAKLYYNPTSFMSDPHQTGTDKASLPATVTFTANSTTGGDYLVKTFTFTVYQSRFAKGVTGIAADATTSISKASTGNLTIASKKLVLADQYSNKVTSDEGIFNTAIFDTTVPDGSTGTAIYIATNGAVNADIVGTDIVATPAAVGTATVYLKYKHTTGSNTAVTASTSNYDAKFAITVYDTSSVDVSTLEIDSVNSGFSMTTTAAKALSTSDITVKALVGGVKTVIPSSQYTIVKNENIDFSNEDNLKGVNSKTAKVTVQVTTWDSVNTPIETQISKEYTVSKEAPKLFKVTGAVTGDQNLGSVASASAVVTASAMQEQFKFKDQYNTAEAIPSSLSSSTVALSLGDLNTGCVTYVIEMIQSAHTDGYTIKFNGLNAATLSFSKNGTYKYKVTATTPDGSSKSYTRTVTITGC